MPRLLRLIILFAAALWLPLQAVAGAFLPLCQHHASTEAVAQGEPPCAMHDAASTESAAAFEQSRGDCDQCGFCHLAGASVLPVALTVSFDLPSSGKDAVSPVPTFLSHIPEPPRHPPRA